MAERIRTEHDFDCTEETFWKLFLDDDYNHALFRDYLKFPRWEIVQHEESNKEMRRTVEVEPYVGELPTPIKKVLGESIGYREIGRLDKEAHRYTFRVAPSRLADKLRVEGEQLTESLDGGKRCRRIFIADFEVKVFGVGAMIEKRLATDMQRSYDLSAKFTRRYLEEKGLVGT